MSEANPFLAGLLGELKPTDVSAEARRSFAAWLREVQPTVDGRRFDFEAFPWLHPIYNLTLEDLPGLHLVVRKAAQMGATVAELLLLCWLATVGVPLKLGFYFPTRDDVSDLVNDRFDPILRENEALKKLAGGGLSDLAKNIDRTSLKRFNQVSVYFRYMKGTASLDSIPLDALIFDERRLMPDASVDRAKLRINESNWKVVLELSTAGQPGVDIDGAFQQSDAHRWFVPCPDPRCPYHQAGFIPEEHFPDCVARGESGYYYCCPGCKHPMPHFAFGEYRPTNPGPGRARGYAFSRLINPRTSPNWLMQSYHQTRNLKEWINGNLGRPYVDKEAQPVDDEKLQANEVEGLSWLEGPAQGLRLCLGADQRGGQIHYVLGGYDQRLGKPRLVKVGVLQGSDGFAQLYRLLERYNVELAVVDALPNQNEAVSLANAMQGRVFVGYYKSNVQMVRWGDLIRTRGTELTAEQGKTDYYVLLDRYQALDAVTSAVAKGGYAWPKTDLLEQRGALTASVKAEFYLHLKSVARQMVVGANAAQVAGGARMEWVNVGGVDPHFLHAMAYLFAAMTRLYGDDVLLPGADPLPLAANPLEALRQQIDPPTPPSLYATRPRCGNCLHFRPEASPAAAPRRSGPGQCALHRFATQADFPPCDPDVWQEALEEAGGDLRRG